MAIITTLYIFTIDGVRTGFTSSGNNTVYDGITCTPLPIKHSNIAMTQNNIKSELSIEVARSESFFKSFITVISETPVEVSIIRNNSIYWTGIVLTGEILKNSIRLGCVSSYVSGKQRKGLWASVDLTCRHALYGSSCKVNQTSYAKTYADVTADSNVITIPAPGIAEEDGYFSGGIAAMGGQERFIVNHTGDVITLSTAFSVIQTGTIVLYPGCDLAETTCHEKFNNVLNFGGFSRAPTKNPFDGGLF